MFASSLESSVKCLVKVIECIIPPIDTSAQNAHSTAMPVFLAAIVLAGVFYWAVPNEHDREPILREVRYTLMASVGLLGR